MTPLDKHKEAALTLWRDKLGFRNDRFGVIDTISAFIATLEAATEARVRRECAEMRAALENLAHEMRFLLRNNPKMDRGLYRRRLSEAEAALGLCSHNCHEGGICLANLSGYPESCSQSPILASGDTTDAASARTLSKKGRDNG